jgi:hypothetical protein
MSIRGRVVVATLHSYSKIMKREMKNKQMGAWRAGGRRRCWRGAKGAERERLGGGGAWAGAGGSRYRKVIVRVELLQDTESRLARRSLSRAYASVLFVMFFFWFFCFFVFLFFFSLQDYLVILVIILSF